MAAGGTLSILIPSSIVFISYGIITEQSVGKLFTVGILPGVLMVTLFYSLIFIGCKLNQALGPTTQGSNWLGKISYLQGTWQVLVLFVLVMGGICSGIVIPTEVRGVDVIGALVLAAFYSEFN